MKKLLSIFSLVPLLCFAQPYAIDRYKIAGGGGTSTNGSFSISGTIGQADAGGTLSGGGFSVKGGFWSLISVVQTAGAPTLCISHSSDTVTVYWQDVSGWTLQQNADVSAANWSASSGVTTSNGTNYLNINSPTGNLFFRLKQP